MAALADLPTVIERLERFASDVVPDRISAFEALMQNAPPESEESLAAWLDEGRSCLLDILEKAGPTELRAFARQLARQLQHHTLPPGVAARVDEWLRLQLIASARRGPGIAERAVRAFGGKTAHVLGFLARSPEGGRWRQDIVQELKRAFPSDFGDESLASHVLRDLDDADLVRRARRGRTVYVELTQAGVELSRQLRRSRQYREPWSTPRSSYGDTDTSSDSTAHDIMQVLRLGFLDWERTTDTRELRGLIDAK